MSKRVVHAPLECKWTGCPQKACLFESREELSFHVNDSHLAECSSQDLFFCLWEGCKVYNKPSYSFEWLKRHIKEKHTKERLNKCLMNGCNMSFNTTEALQRHLQRHFDRTPPPTPTPPKPVAAVKATKNTKKTPCPAILSDDFGCSSLSQSADEDYLLEMEEGPEDSEASDDSYVPRNQASSSGQRRPLKIKISRRSLGVQPYPERRPSLAVNGAHFHSDNPETKAMNVIKQTINELAAHEQRQDTCSTIAVRAKVLGKRRCTPMAEEELLIRWYPRLVPDEWTKASDVIKERIIPFSQLSTYQLGILATNCLSNELNVHRRRSKRKP